METYPSAIYILGNESRDMFFCFYTEKGTPSQKLFLYFIQNLWSKMTMEPSLQMINPLKVLISYRRHMLRLKWYSLTPIDTVLRQKTHTVSLAIVILCTTFGWSTQENTSSTISCPKSRLLYIVKYGMYQQMCWVYSVGIWTNVVYTKRVYMLKLAFVEVVPPYPQIMGNKL